MKFLGLLSLLSTMSLSTYGFGGQTICKSLEVEKKILTFETQVTQEETLVHGLLLSEDQNLALSGTLTNSLSINTYSLLDHKGEEHTFKIETKIDFPSFSHCRARICPSQPTIPKVTASLTSGEDVEYFKCL